MALDIDLGDLSRIAERPEPDGASDAEYFANLDIDAIFSSPNASSASIDALDKGVTDNDGMIDFDVFEMPDFAPVKPKLPRT